MGASDFAKFVEAQQVSSAERDVDYGAIRDEFLQKLDSLYQQIAGYLQGYENAGQITHNFSHVTLEEDNIGAYSAPKMVIKIGKQNVYLEPVGTLLIGSAGRVDVSGSAGRALFLLVNEKTRSMADQFSWTVTIGSKGSAPLPPQPTTQPIVWAWKIVTQGARREFVELNEESFFALLMEVANA